MSNLLKNLIIALCLTILLGVVYFFTIGRSSDDLDSDEGITGLSTEAARRTQRILADTKRIDEYKLDVSIFDDMRFTTLRDFSVVIPDVATGRPNPFAPIE